VALDPRFADLEVELREFRPKRDRCAVAFYLRDIRRRAVDLLYGDDGNPQLRNHLAVGVAKQHLWEAVPKCVCQVCC
jgi:hypothetical protein